MRKEYDLKSLKVKRRRVQPALRGPTPEQAKVRVTVALDRDLVEHFRETAGQRRASLIRRFAPSVSPAETRI